MDLEETNGTFLAVEKATERATTGVDHLGEYIQVPFRRTRDIRLTVNLTTCTTRTNTVCLSFQPDVLNNKYKVFGWVRFTQQ